MIYVYGRISFPLKKWTLFVEVVCGSANFSFTFVYMVKIGPHIFLLCPCLESCRITQNPALSVPNVNFGPWYCRDPVISSPRTCWLLFCIVKWQGHEGASNHFPKHMWSLDHTKGLSLACYLPDWRPLLAGRSCCGHWNVSFLMTFAYLNVMPSR